jgi:hypothetical protein
MSLSFKHARASIAVATAVIAASLSLAVPPTSAGTIGFQITTTVETGPGVTAKIDVTNTGDEDAYNVKPSILFQGETVEGDGVESIPPNGKKTWTIPVLDGDAPAGAHVIVVRMGYEDANSYPFDVLATTPFTVSATKRNAVQGRLVVPHLAERGTRNASLSLKIPKVRGNRFRVDLIAPRALKLTPAHFEVDASEKRDFEFAFKVKNDGLLAGTHVAMIAAIRSLDEPFSQTDLLRGIVQVPTGGASDGWMRLSKLNIALVALVIVFLGLEIYGFRKRRGGAGSLPPNERLLAVAEALLVLGPSAFLVYHYPWNDLLAATVPAGGDMASLYYPTKLLAEEIMPRGELTGWTMGNYAGFPILQFYSTLPFAFIVVLGKLMPMQVAFKVTSLLGPTLLPLAAAYLFRCLGYGRGAAVIAATSVIPFLFQQGNSMWGGNIPSVLAGEYCHAIGLMLSLVYLGVLHKSVEGRGSWPLAAVLLAAIGLSHTFSVFAAIAYSLFYLWPRRDVLKLAPPVVATGIFAFLLVCFWGLPLPSRLIWTSEFSMIWRIADWKEVLPEPLWPAAILSAANVLAMLVRVKEFRAERHGLLLFNFFGGALLYFIVPALGFPDIRFIPVSQLFLCLLAADMIFWLGTAFGHQLVFASCILLAGVSWGDSHIGYIPSWLKWNYSGYERKPTWKLFEAINEHIKGDMNDPRVMFEHSQAHNRFGSSRAFENIPLFSGRSTLEGVFHQASQNSPFIFYLQSEASERGSGPFPQYTYTRMDPDKALPHLHMYNVSELVVVSEKAKTAYEAHPNFERTFRSGAYEVFRVLGGDPRYVIPAANEPVLYRGKDWKLAFYRWFRHPDLLDTPLVPEEMISSEQARRFELRTDSVRRLEHVPIGGADDCEVTSTLEQYRIEFRTSCPDRPHIVKISYFPRWAATDDSTILPVSPGYMLVYPNSDTVVIEYRRQFIDWFGMAMTATGALILLVCFISPRVRESMETTLTRPFVPLLVQFQKHPYILSVVLLVTFIGTGAATRITLRTPDREYEKAQEAYRARDFDEAIRRLEDWTSQDKDTFKQSTALYQLGVAHSDVKNHAASIQTHERLLFQFPNVNYGAGTLFHLSRNYLALDAKERAQEYADRLVAEFPDTGWVKRLQRELPALARAVPPA